MVLLLDLMVVVLDLIEVLYIYKLVYGILQDLLSLYDEQQEQVVQLIQYDELIDDDELEQQVEVVELLSL